LRVTATNAFAARWLVPRLPKWREAHPRLKLDIVGTDVVLSLKTVPSIKAFVAWAVAAA
jgi:LysR family glycine cleavage system transcriptional activator